MSDKSLAQCARSLATALLHYAKERDDDSKKRINYLHFELCQLYKIDLQEQQDAEHIARTSKADE